MKRLFVRLAILMVATSSPPCVDRVLGQSPESVGSAAAAKTTKFPYLVLEGSPYECGHRHGKALKEKIHSLVQLWKADIKRRYSDPESFIKRFVEETGYRRAIEKWVPGLIEEIKGIADGAGLDFNTAFVFQFGDETWVRGDLVREHCSSLGFSRTDTDATYIAQNLDLETYRDGFQVVLHIKHQDTDLESLIITNAGSIGWGGVNNKRIGVLANSIMELKDSPNGLPASAVIRGLLMQRSEKDAVAFVRRIKHATGLNYVIGGPQHVYSFEASTNKVVRFRPNDQDDVVWHTNHPLINDDYTDEYKAALKRINETGPVGFEVNTRIRLDTLRRRIKGHPTRPRLAHIKEILASKDSQIHPICGSKGESEHYTEVGVFSFSAIIMVLSESPHMHATFGPSDQNEFETFTFTGESN